VTKFAPHNTLQSIVSCKLTFDGRTVIQPVGGSPSRVAGIQLSDFKFEVSNCGCRLLGLGCRAYLLEVGLPTSHQFPDIDSTRYLAVSVSECEVEVEGVGRRVWVLALLGVHVALPPLRCPVKREQLERWQGFFPGSQGQNLAFT